VELSGNNTYTGATTINGGTTLQSGSNSALGTGVVTINATGTLDLHSPSLTVGGLSGNGVVTTTAGVAGSTSTLSVGNGNQTTFGGVFQDGTVQEGAVKVGLTKVGGGKLTLTGGTGPTTYSGKTTVVGGTLQVGNNTTTGLLVTVLRSTSCRPWYLGSVGRDTTFP
jgi:fibronectin-binding autotransporter adhesin